MKRYPAFRLLILSALLFFYNDAESSEIYKKPQPLPFREIWGYMMRGEENLFRGTEPVTDLFYFSCGINYRGRLNTNVTPPVLPDFAERKRKMHIVIADISNTSLMHFVLNRSYGAMDKLINDIVDVSQKFDGVQIDFESIASEDRDAFLDFLTTLKSRLEAGKVLSVALPARRTTINDAYSYSRISAIADKIFIMTYDQHWSTGSPGSVASVSWCTDVIRYASCEIPADKLVMGIPFYGRSWQDKSHNRAIRNKNLQDMLSKDDIVKEYSDDSGYRIVFKDIIDVILYCDDIKAIRAKLELYKQFVNSVGFWRLGFESPEVWDEMIVSAE